jgi:hypothetical protein
VTNKKKLTVIGSAAVATVGARALRRARRRAHAAGAAEGIAEAIQPSVADRAHATVEQPQAGAAHAPGHAHLDRASIRTARDSGRSWPRPFAKHRRGLRQPGRLL